MFVNRLSLESFFGYHYGPLFGLYIKGIWIVFFVAGSRLLKLLCGSSVVQFSFCAKLFLLSEFQCTSIVIHPGLFLHLGSVCKNYAMFHILHWNRKRGGGSLHTFPDRKMMVTSRCPLTQTRIFQLIKNRKHLESLLFTTVNEGNGKVGWGNDGLLYIFSSYHRNMFEANFCWLKDHDVVLVLGFLAPLLVQPMILLCFVTIFLFLDVLVV